MTQTAKDLFIHRNTCSYRLEQIQNILSIDLSKPDTIFRLRAALMIKELQNLL